MIWVWCSYNERTHGLCIYRCLLTYRLQGKTAELCMYVWLTAGITE